MAGNRSCKFTSESIGYLPLYCFQCQQGRPHDTRRLFARRGLLGLFRRVRYGLVSICPECGLSCGIDPDLGASVLSETPSDIAEAAHELFGEENAVQHWARIQSDIDVGLATPEMRLDAIAAVYDAVGCHFTIPRSVASPAPKWRNPLVAVLWTSGVATIAMVCYYINDHRGNPIESTIVASAIISVVYSAVMLFLLQYEHSAQNQVQLRRREIERRLADGLCRIRPDGHELSRVRDFAAQNRWWSALPDTHDVLFKIEKRATARAVA